MSPDDPNRTKVEIIVKEADRMEAILRMMLSYIQPLDLNMSLMDPNSLVRTVLKNLDSRIQERKVKVGLQLAPDTADLCRPATDGACTRGIDEERSQSDARGRNTVDFQFQEGTELRSNHPVSRYVYVD